MVAFLILAQPDVTAACEYPSIKLPCQNASLVDVVRTAAFPRARLSTRTARGIGSAARARRPPG